MYVILAFNSIPSGTPIIKKEANFRCRMCGTELTLHDVAIRLSRIAQEESMYTKIIQEDSFIESFPGIYVRHLDWNSLIFLVIDVGRVSIRDVDPFEIFSMTVEL